MTRDVPPVRPLRERRTEPRDHSLLNRRRFQFAGALLVGALVPWAVRGPLLPGTMFEHATLNSVVGNAVAVVIAFWLRLSIEIYPGIRRSAVIFPATLTGHGTIVAWFLLTRLPYDRIALLAGFMLHMMWLYLLYIYADRNLRRTIGVVPFGAVDQLRQINSVEWRMLRRPRLADVRKCDAIVADFAADLPDEWEAFLADAALDGRMVYQVKQLGESLTGQVELEHLSENSFGSLLPARGYFYFKSVADILVAILILPLIAPFMVVTALAIFADDGGPVLFRQRRLGHSGKIFTAYKFRTMQTLDAGGETDEQQVRSALATDDFDPRITRVGEILRKYRIDEMPQILNILRGEMSWIGPRPEPEILTRWFVAEIPFYRYRHVVKPGISGWAQVNLGYVSGVDGIHHKLKFDFYYIKYFSPWLDVLILFRTIKTMLSGFGAR